MNVRLNLSGFFIEYNGRVIASESMNGTDEEKLKRADEVMSNIAKIGLDKYIKSIERPKEPTMVEILSEKIEKNKTIKSIQSVDSYNGECSSGHTNDDDYLCQDINIQPVNRSKTLVIENNKNATSSYSFNGNNKIRIRGVVGSSFQQRGQDRYGDQYTETRYHIIRNNQLTIIEFN